MFPGLEPSDEREKNMVFGCRYGLAVETPTSVNVQVISSHELLSLFLNLKHQATIETFDDEAVNAIVRFSTPQFTKLEILNYVTNESAFAEDIYFGNFEVCETTKCYFTKGPPELIKWNLEYDIDITTRTIIHGLQQHKGNDWCPEELQNIHQSYHNPLRKSQIQLVDGKLIFFKPIFQNIKYIGLIIAPEPLRNKLFSHYHASPIGGHVGEYKTLFRMRQRFHWPNMREDIKKWIKGCPHCIECNIWRKRNSELHFSWPITAPFYIMHVDLSSHLLYFNCLCRHNDRVIIILFLHQPCVRIKHQTKNWSTG